MDAQAVAAMIMLIITSVAIILATGWLMFGDH